MAGFHRLHYVSWGQASDHPTSICVHGLQRNSRDFDFLAQDLAKDRLVVCPDMVGRGLSDWMLDVHGYTYPQYMADLTGLIARLHQDIFDWIGTSMGGVLGMILAALPKNPIRRLVLNDVGAMLPATTLRKMRHASRQWSFTSLEMAEKYLQRVLASFGPLTKEQIHHYASHCLKQTEVGTYIFTYDPKIVDTYDNGERDVELWPFWEKVSCPTLLIRGQESEVLTLPTVQRMKEMKPDLEIVEFPGVGHAPALMEFSQIQLIRTFLDRPNY